MINNEDLSSSSNGSQMPKERYPESKDILYLKTIATEHFKSSCYYAFKTSLSSISYLRGQAAKFGKTADDTAIVIINVDDEYMTEVANSLFPGDGWSQYRDDVEKIPFYRGDEIRYFRGLVAKKDTLVCLDCIDEEAADKLRQMSGLAVVVIDFGVAEVYPAVSFI